jgi:hypothetical protein
MTDETNDDDRELREAMRRALPEWATGGGHAILAELSRRLGRELTAGEHEVAELCWKMEAEVRVAQADAIQANSELRTAVWEVQVEASAILREAAAEGEPTTWVAPDDDLNY